LGQPGQFGVANLATHIATGVNYAVKTLSKARIASSNFAHHAQLMRNEIDVMTRVSSLKHRNVIQFKEYFEDAQSLYLVMECAAGGELYDRITARHQYSEKDAQVVVRQMLEAVRAVHTLDICHADIKPVCM
jgi:calcium-dependent protein kinase